jgi:hypothetical protein
LIPTPLLRSIKISRSGFFILSNPNSLSPKKKRKHNMLVVNVGMTPKPGAGAIIVMSSTIRFAAAQGAT